MAAEHRTISVQTKTLTHLNPGGTVLILWSPSQGLGTACPPRLCSLLPLHLYVGSLSPTWSFQRSPTNVSSTLKQTPNIIVQS